MASQKNPNTDPDDLAASFSTWSGGTCTGGGKGKDFFGKGTTFPGLALTMGEETSKGIGDGERAVVSGKRATFPGLETGPTPGLALFEPESSQGFGVRGGVMKTVYLPAFPITGGGGASRARTLAIARQAVSGKLRAGLGLLIRRALSPSDSRFLSGMRRRSEASLSHSSFYYLGIGPQNSQ